MSAPPRLVDRSLLMRRLARAAPGALRHAFLLERVAEDFIERLHVVRRTFPEAADIGAYLGILARTLCDHPAVGRIVSLEPCPALLEACPAPRLISDLEQLPFAEASLDLVVSGLALHLVDDLPGTLVQIRRALKPDGLMLAAVLGGETLVELRQSWLDAEAELAGGASPRVVPFADVRTLGGLLHRAGFALPVADADLVTVTYSSPIALMAELKAMGMSNMLAERRRVPVTRTLLARAAEIYARRFGMAGGRVPATFEIVTLTAWAPHESQQKPLKPGSATQRLAEALGVKEAKL